MVKRGQKVYSRPQFRILNFPTLSESAIWQSLTLVGNTLNPSKHKDVEPICKEKGGIVNRLVLLKIFLGHVLWTGETELRGLSSSLGGDLLTMAFVAKLNKATRQETIFGYVYFRSALKIQQTHIAASFHPVISSCLSWCIHITNDFCDISIRRKKTPL